MFEWDENKNQINIEKHGVDFNIAWTAFNDINQIYEVDDEHSINEERVVLIGMAQDSKLLYVCLCYRKKGENDIIRLISARKANKNETYIFWRHCMKRYIRNNDIAKRLRENGCTIRVTRGDGNQKEIIEERIVTPEEIALMNEHKNTFSNENRIQY
jgi:uncharacterized DUF497 family protein